MDAVSKKLDKEYMAIQDSLKKAEMHRQAVLMLKSAGVEAADIDEAVRKHEQEILRLQEEVTAARLQQVQDFMLLEDLRTLEILRLRYIDFLTWEEISAKLGCCRDSLMKRRDRGLREILKKRRDLKNT